MVDCPAKDVVLKGDPDTLALYLSPSSSIADLVMDLRILTFYVVCAPHYKFAVIT
jgi:hypothetical protein